MSKTDFSHYREQQLPRTLQMYWDNEEALTEIIADAFQHECYLEVEEAIEHLLKINPASESAICLYSSFLIHTQKYAEAETYCLEKLAENPNYAEVLASLAKAQNYLGKYQEALNTLESAMHLNPNQASAFDWWYGNQQELLLSNGLSGKEARLEALQTINQQFPGWRAKLELANHYAAEKDESTAQIYYKAILRKTTEPAVLTAISDALLKYALPKALIELIVPIYNINEHAFKTGLNMLQAYLDLDRKAEGEALLEALYRTARLDQQTKLEHFQHEFTKPPKPITPEIDEIDIPKDILRELDDIPEPFRPTPPRPPMQPDPITPPPKPAANIEIEAIKFPIWCYGWNIKHELNTSQSGKKVALFQWTSETDTPSTTAISRALPLYILEAIYYGTDGSAHFHFPVSDEEDAIILERPTPVKHITALSKKGYAGVLTGHIAGQKLTLTYWNLLTGAKNQIHIPLDTEHPDIDTSKAENFLFKHADMTFDRSFKSSKRGFSRVDSAHQHQYLMQLSAHSLLYIAKHPNLSDEETIIKNMLKLTKSAEVLQTQLNLISMIHLYMKNQSSGIKAQQPEILACLRHMPKHFPVLKHIVEKTTNVFSNYCA